MQRLSHDLDPDLLERWGELRSRRRLRRDPSFREREHEVARILAGFDWDLQPVGADRSAGPVHAVAWNIERGKRFEPLLGVLQGEPRLAGADLMLLSEVDAGMGRSGNRHVAREVARHLGLGYVFAPAHLVLSPGDVAERDATPNTDAMHGVALLTRYPVTRLCGVPLPEYVDKFRVLEKRLGWKRALVAEVMLPGGPTTVAVVHLDPFSPPRHRARQIRRVLDAIGRFGNERVLLGGDLNTTTYDLGTAPGLAFSLAYKLVRFGFEGTVRHYMTPEAFFERRIFRALDRAGLRIEGFTDPSQGTIYFDLNDPEVVAKAREYVPMRVFRWLERRLEPWGGRVPLRFDWFAGRGLAPREAHVIDEPRHRGVRVSDHNPVIVHLER